MGCFFGGEYAVGHTFAIEFAPQHRRGAIAGFVQSGFPLGYVFASLVVALISAMAGDAGMLAYGWRICLHHRRGSRVPGFLDSNLAA